MDPRWLNVNVTAQIWSGHSDDHHKQGKLFPPAAVWVIDEYKGSYQFSKVRLTAAGFSTIKIEEGYPQTWIRAEDTSLIPFEEPEDEPDEEPDNEDEPDDGPWSSVAVGAAIRIILDAGGSVSFP